MTYGCALRVWHLEMAHGPAQAGVYMVLVGGHIMLVLEYCCYQQGRVAYLKVATSFGQGRLHSDTEGAVIIWLAMLVFWGRCFILLSNCHSRDIKAIQNYIIMIDHSTAIRNIVSFTLVVGHEGGNRVAHWKEKWSTWAENLPPLIS